MRELGVYIHIPFCVHKCSYCDFLSFPADEGVKKNYADALLREIRAYRETMRGHMVTSVFLGGGTPSVMPVDCLYAIMHAVRETFHLAADAEITMEMNPGTVTTEMAEFAAQELTRVSLGAQSFSDDELRALGRIHTADEIRESVRMLKSYGIFNINLDLMSGLPKQDETTWERTLENAAALGVPHISAYSLIVEEGTPFDRLYEDGNLPLPDEDTEREMYHRTLAILGDAGYKRYEISNYAKEGYACRHNIKYWRRTEYLGLGPGAASFFDRRRWSDTRDMDFYMKKSGNPPAIRTDEEHLSREEEMEEFMFLGLRMMDGVGRADFEKAFGTTMEEIYGNVLRGHIAEGVLRETEGGYALTERGIDVSNIVLADYLLE
ncbi:MAG: radical SAM family heme chaperone HemW [Lachnospiraceae bacterium]|nr:radical SAM family heme chaperone HemW [Lachnospiraceae bacterium]